MLKHTIRTITISIMKHLNREHYVFTAKQCKILTNIIYPKDICIDALLSKMNLIYKSLKPTTRRKCNHFIEYKKNEDAGKLPF